MRYMALCLRNRCRRQQDAGTIVYVSMGTMLSWFFLIYTYNQHHSVASKDENRRKISSLNFFSYNWIFTWYTLSTGGGK